MAAIINLGTLVTNQIIERTGLALNFFSSLLVFASMD